MTKGKIKNRKKHYSGIDAHKRQKKTLVPPLMNLPKLSLQSWMNDRLPEMLWGALLISECGRETALETFRNAAALVKGLPLKKRMIEPTLSGLALLDEEVLRKFLLS
jgi:hypothetical protein